MATPVQTGLASDFRFYTQAQVFENLAKSDQKRHMRIGGPIGSECEDLAKEVVLQDGLDYQDFLGLRGFFNKNHSADTLDILGAPETVKLYRAGEQMPNGQVAKHSTTWVEGFLYDTAKGRETYELAKAMQGSGRSLGFSIEGHVEQRTGEGNRTIAKARIQNVAITHVPCNPDARLEVLLRSVSQVNAGQDFKKTFTVGHGALAISSDGYDVPLVDAKDPKAEDKDKPTALPYSREQLDQRIVAVVQPMLLQAVIGGLNKSLHRAKLRHRAEQQAQWQADADRLLAKSARQAAKKVAKLAANRPAVAKSAPQSRHGPILSTGDAKKSHSTGQLLQSIYQAMPGISADYAQGLAMTIRRESARS